MTHEVHACGWHAIHAWCLLHYTCHLSEGFRTNLISASSCRPCFSASLIYRLLCCVTWLTSTVLPACWPFPGTFGTGGVSGCQPCPADTFSNDIGVRGVGERE